jgi:hypothetical protein
VEREVCMHTVRDFTTARAKALVIQDNKVQLIQGNELDKEYQFTDIPKICSVPSMLEGMKISNDISTGDLDCFGTAYTFTGGTIVVPFRW